MITKLSLVLLPLLAYADLPIHCIYEQVFGRWRLEFTEATEQRQMCGYNSPDTNAHHFLSYKYDFKAKSSTVFEVSPPHLLQEKTEIDSLGYKGDMKWTMVYDEGIHFHVNDKAGEKNAFAFFQYKPKFHSVQSDKPSKYVSYCDRTRVGWYHTKKDDKLLYGCFKAYRIAGLDGPKPSRENQLSMQPEQNVVSADSLVDIRESPNGKFHFNLSFIDEVNADPQSSWKAYAHDHLHDKISLLEAYQMLGVSSYMKPSQKWDRRTYEKRVSLMENDATISLVQSDAPAKELPKNFDWREKVEDIRAFDQGSCGSCYAVSSTMMSTIRHSIAMSKKEGRFMELRSGAKLSITSEESLAPQDVLNCSPANQGCKGGYPFLVGWHAYRHGMTSKMEEEYLGVDLENSCKADAKRVKATGYYYIGGHYGAGNEQALMEDIYEKGPATVGIDAPSSLFLYRSGIFNCHKTKHEGTNMKDLHPWEATNHAVLVYGWGETQSGDKYWILKNSWGASWGEKGFFKLPRDGKDQCAITSMPVGISYD
mmetsp:Transcript_42301/g.70554  ORF Transcript_42301/g.70554 Transcript_42301/m.70554 type:complete len:537 (-) Transcript_42301:217-1827(-)